MTGLAFASMAHPDDLRIERAVATSVFFWGIAYCILTGHALLDPTSSGMVISAPRLLTTAAGASLLLAICMLWQRTEMLALFARLRMAGAAIVASCAAMYVVRLLVAKEFGSYGATELADGGRWVIAWAGYFLAAVSTTAAWQALRDNSRLRAHIAMQADYECSDNPLAPSG